MAEFQEAPKSRVIEPRTDLPPGLRTCKTCARWLLWEHGVNGEGRCSRPDLDDKSRSDSLWTIGSAGHKGLRLMTGPDFGCVHHEERL